MDRFGPGGGAEQLAAQLAARYDRARFASTLCATRWSPDNPPDAAAEAVLPELRAAGVKVIGLGRKSRVDPRPWRRLVTELRHERVDVLHTHMFGSNLWGALLGTLARTPVIVAHEHTWSFEGAPLRRFADREVIARAAGAMIAVSREDRRRMIEIERIPADRVRYIPNGAPPAVPPDGSDVRAELGIPAAAPVIGSVGALRAQKAYPVLLEAVALLVGRQPDLHVLIAGGGEERSLLEERIAALGLQRNVRLLGRRTDVPAVLRAVDVAVMSSDYEGMPLSILEYMAAGLPVVATRVGGVPDLVEHEVTGLLVEPRDPDGIAAAVATLLGDRRRAAAMGDRGRARRSAVFDLDVMVRRLEALYVELLGGDARAVASTAGPSASSSQSNLV